MRGLATICALLASAASSFAVPEKFDIPKQGWEPSFFETINALTEKTGWTPLRRSDLAPDTLELRVWVGFGRVPLQGFRLCRKSGVWTGNYVRDGFAKEWSFENRSVKPADGWQALWQKIEKLGILTLPDSSTFPSDGRYVSDGVCYVVESSDGRSYRTYMYNNPQEHNWPEGAKMISIAEALYEELVSKAK